MGKNILFVEDEEEVCRFAKTRLEKAGFSVEIAHNGKEGLAVVSAVNIDLIVTDVFMPLMDGVDFYKELRHRRETAHIPVIILSAKNSLEDSFRALGANDFISKPFEGHELINRIEKILALSSKKEKRGKIIIFTKDKPISHEMQRLIIQNGIMSEAAESAADLMALALGATPRMIIIDILLEQISAKEIIKALRCFNKLKDIDILIFGNFQPGSLNANEMAEQLSELKDACLAAGATKYIGRYTPVTFINTLSELGY